MAEERTMLRSARVMGWLLTLPELNVLFFGFLLSLPWELFQVPFYEDMALMHHWEGVQRCSRAAAGDALLLLIAYTAVAASTRRHRWIARPAVEQVLGFVATALVSSVVLERFRLGGAAWTYLETMPLVPGLRVGLWPFLQWIVVPLIVAGILHRQLRASSPWRT